MRLWGRLLFRSGILFKRMCETDLQPLRYLNSNSRGFEVPESYIILNRSGTNVISTSLLSKTICKGHRDTLGVYWKRSKRSCAHPFRGDGTTKPDRGITPVMSRELWLRMQLVIPVGECKQFGWKLENPRMARLSRCIEFGYSIYLTPLKVDIIFH